jgi:hypothetical protein
MGCEGWRRGLALAPGRWLMGSLEKADKLNTAMPLADRLRQCAGAAGIDGWMKGLATVSLGALWAVLVRMEDGLPFWADCLLGLALAIASTHLYIALRIAWSLRGLKAQDIAELGTQCVEFRDDVFRYLIAEQGSTANEREWLPASQDALAYTKSILWEMPKTHDGAPGSESIGRFKPRLVAIVQLLKNAGIRGPDIDGFDRNPSSAAAYVGAVGVLLEQGLLAEAREFDPED